MINTENKKNIVAYIILIALAGFMISIIFKNGFLYGSTTDWISQSSVFPEYFRQKFYETGKFFPDFAMNLGGGQNIYYFSYYGLFNPIILISYLIPNVSMVTYIQASSIVIVILSACLCYQWFKMSGFSFEISLISAVCFLFAGPVIFHSHRQLMFVNYFPFLFISLIGLLQYYKKRKRWLFILGVFLCIMTSYFFSVGCIFVLLFYACYQYLEKSSKPSLRIAWDEFWPLIKGIGIAVFMAAVLWLPTLYVILNGRSGNTSAPSSLSQLMPNFTYFFSAILYDGYSLGLTAISLIALIATLFSRKKSEKLLSLVLLLFIIFPAFSYFLSGTLYARPKALIPFLPLYILIIAIFITKIVIKCKNKNHYLGKTIVPILFVYLLSVSSINCLIVNEGNQPSINKFLNISIMSQIQRKVLGDTLVASKQYSEIHNPDKMELIDAILQKDPSFYRINDLTGRNMICNQVYKGRYYHTSLYSSTFNTGYNRFYFDVIHNPIASRNRSTCSISNDIFFQNYMNVKYIVASEEQDVPAGYYQILQKGKFILYENDHTLPLAFSTDRIVSQKDFDAQMFPYNMSTLFENIIVDKNTKLEGKTKNLSSFDIKKIKLTDKMLTAGDQKNVTIENENGRYFIQAKKNATLEIPINMDLDDNILILQFDVSNEKNREDLDTFITINGIRNKLSQKIAMYPNDNYHFIYTISSSMPSKKLSVQFSEGIYEIYGLEAYILPKTDLEKVISKRNPFIVDTKKVIDNQISGNIQVTNDGYFATTLPYDKGYKITVDQEEQSYEKVNTAFVGFPIKKGTHYIQIEYHAPYKKEGIVLTFAGFALFAFSIFIDEKRSRRLQKNHGG